MRLHGDLLEVAKNTLSVTTNAAQHSEPASEDCLPGFIAEGKDLVAQANEDSNLYDAIKELLSLLEGFNRIAQLVSEVRST